MKEQDATLLVLALLFVFIFVVAAVTFTKPIPSTGTIKVTALECDTQSLDFGVLEPGETANRTVHVRAEGQGALALTFNISDWQPSGAGQWLNLSWNYNGSSVGQEWFPIVFVLAVASEIVGVRMFNFTINIYGIRCEVIE